MLQHYVKPFLDQSLGERIDTGGGFVKDEDRWALQLNAGQCTKLALAHRKTAAAFPDFAIQAVGQAVDPIAAADLPRHGDHFFVSRVTSAVADILHDRAIEQERRL